MGARQVAHLPPRTSHPSSGMLWYQRIAVPHVGQLDRGKDDGRAARQAVDADVEEAADHQAEQAEDGGQGERGDGGVHRGRLGALSAGRGRSGESSATSTVPV